MEQGIFLFGGIDENEQNTDDFFWLTPNITQNAKCISVKNGEYNGLLRPELKFTAIRLTPEGRSPIARS